MRRNLLNLCRENSLPPSFEEIQPITVTCLHQFLPVERNSQDFNYEVNKNLSESLKQTDIDGKLTLKHF